MVRPTVFLKKKEATLTERIAGNQRAITHDPVTYPEPSKFRPERFLDPVTSAPLPNVTFGFGRRICPGQFFARDMLWSAMASMLAAFEFLPAKDAEGRPAPPAQEFISAFVS